MQILPVGYLAARATTPATARVGSLQGCNRPIVNSLREELSSSTRLTSCFRAQTAFSCQRSVNKIYCCKATVDDDISSSGSVAVGIYKRHIAADRGGTTDRWLKEFVQASISAYACGCSEEGLRKELLQTQDLALTVEEVEDCVLNAALVWVTLESTPERMCRRWATTPAVSSEVSLTWKGFCTLITNAYYVHGMAWFPVQRLQLEQLAVAGRVEHPSIVSSRMRLVFTTLEVVDPRWDVWNIETLVLHDATKKVWLTMNDFVNQWKKVCMAHTWVI